MIIENVHPDYQIRNLTCKKEAGCYRLSWRYKEASDFLVFFYDSRRAFKIWDVPKQMQAAGLKDAQLAASAKKLQAAGHALRHLRIRLQI